MDELEEYLGKTVKLHVVINEHSLYYTAKILSCKGSFITFTDREQKRYTYSKDCIKGLALEE